MSAASPAMISACSTVRVVVGEALQAAVNALTAAAADAATVAQSHWQSAHAALRVVNHQGLVQFSQELGNLISSASGAQPVAKAVAAGKYQLKVIISQPEVNARFFKFKQVFCF